MPYDINAHLRHANPVSAYIGARDNAMQNALMQRKQQQDEEAQAFNQDNALFNQRRAVEQDQRAVQKDAADAEAQDAVKLRAYVEQLAAAKTPEHFNFLADQIWQTPAARRKGISREELTPETVRQFLSAAQAETGQGPAAEPRQFVSEDGPRGSVLQRDPVTGELRQVVGPDNTQPAPPKPAATYRTLSPAEIAAAGLPAGTAAQIGPDGKVDVLSKRDNTGVLSQKDATTAKMKINTIALARSQLAKIKEAFEEGRKGINAFGGGQGWLPTQQGKKFDARVNQMRSTLTALTRVPGVGAMSDYETKLDQSKFPSRTQYESVTADTIQNLEDQLALLENGYAALLSGGEMPGQGPDAAPKETAAQRAARMGL